MTLPTHIRVEWDIILEMMGPQVTITILWQLDPASDLGLDAQLLHLNRSITIIIPAAMIRRQFMNRPMPLQPLLVSVACYLKKTNDT